VIDVDVRPSSALSFGGRDLRAHGHRREVDRDLMVFHPLDQALWSLLLRHPNCSFVRIGAAGR
jgi:hypothetical protein